MKSILPIIQPLESLQSAVRFPNRINLAVLTTILLDVDWFQLGQKVHHTEFITSPYGLNGLVGSSVLLDRIQSLQHKISALRLEIQYPRPVVQIAIQTHEFRVNYLGVESILSYERLIQSLNTHKPIWRDIPDHPYRDRLYPSESR